MKTLALLLLTLVFLAGCQAEPTYTDNGNPGQIQAIAFLDENNNGRQDSGEAGFPALLGISQEISCPPNSKADVTMLTAGADGVALWEGLAPGKYCVAPYENYGMTTKMTQEVYVSSDETTTVWFGIAGD